MPTFVLSNLYSEWEDENDWVEGLVGREAEGQGPEDPRAPHLPQQGQRHQQVAPDRRGPGLGFIKQ